MVYLVLLGADRPGGVVYDSLGVVCTLIDRVAWFVIINNRICIGPSIFFGKILLGLYRNNNYYIIG